MIAISDVAASVNSFDPMGDGEAAKSKELITALLAWSALPFSRETYTPGHITCTGAVLSPEGERLLLVHHRRLDRWLLPGGHVEDADAAISDVARREVMEETGVRLAAATHLVNLDVHAIPGNKREPLHLHHDLIWSFRALSENLECSEESREVIWCGLADFDRYQLPANIRRSAMRCLALAE